MVNVVVHFGGTHEKPKLSLSALGDIDNAKKNGRRASWWLANNYLSRKSTPDVVLFGSSQLGGLQAADADLLNSTQDYVLNHECVSVERQLKQEHLPASCFAIGMVGSMISDHYLISRVLFSPQNSPKLMVVTVSPRDFIDSKLPSVTSTEVFRFFSPYISDSTVSADLLTDPVEKISWYATNMPIRNAWRGGRIESDSVEKLGPSGEQSNKPMQRISQDPLLTTNNESMALIRPGQCVVTPHMADFFVDNSTDYKKRYSSSHGPMYKRQFDCFSKLLSAANAQGISVLVVGMPLDASNWSLLPATFWQDYRGRLQTACAKNGCAFVEWSHDAAFGRGDFVDGVHLNARGGGKLAQKIAQAISQAPTIVAALGGSETRAKLADVRTIDQ